MEFGKSLRAAREAKGYTVSQLAEATHLVPSVVERLENEDFSHIPAPIYGRGFVKLYCEGVGLEAKPFVDEFMEIINGNHESSIRERPVELAPATEPQPEPMPDLQPEPELFSAQSEAEPALSRYATPYRDDERTRTPFSNLTIPFRLVALTVGAIVVLILLGWGIRSLYRTTMPTTSEAAGATPAETAAKPATAPRTPQEIPALYLD